MSTSTSDLAGALWSIGTFLLVFVGIIAVAALVIWIGRRRGRDTGVIDAALVISGGYVILLAVGLPFSIAQTLTADSVFVWDLPVNVAWPGDLPCGQPTTDPGPYLECATIAQTNASIVGLPLGTRAVLAGGQLLGGLLMIAPAAAIGVICFQLLRGAPFARVTSRTLLATAGFVLVAGVAADLLTGVGRGLAALEVLPSSALPDATGPTTSYSLAVQIWPFGAALALVALAAVFRYGARIERDTAGLV